MVGLWRRLLWDPATATTAGSAGVPVSVTSIILGVVTPVSAAPGDSPGTAPACRISCSRPRISFTIAIDRVWDASVSSDTDSNFASRGCDSGSPGASM